MAVLCQALTFKVYLVNSTRREFTRAPSHVPCQIPSKVLLTMINLECKGLAQYRRMTDGRGTYSRNFFHQKIFCCSPHVENSAHFSIAAVPLFQVTAPSTPLIGKKALCLSLVVVSVGHVSQPPLFSLAVPCARRCAIYLGRIRGSVPKRRTDRSTRNTNYHH